MPYVRVKVEGVDCAVELDHTGCVIGAGKGPDYRLVTELPEWLVKALRAKVRIERNECVLDGGRVHTYYRACIDGHDCGGHTVVELCVAYASHAESVDYAADPHSAAYRASAILAADKGVPSHLEANDYDGWDVVTDNGKRFQFRKG
jgi:hypothetical protein